MEENKSNKDEVFFIDDTGLKKPKKIRTKKQMRIRFWSITAILVVIAVFLGQFVGNWIVNSYLNVFTFAGDENSLKESSQTIEKWKTKSVDQMSPVEAFLVAQYNLENSPSFTMTLDGKIVSTGVTQTVYSYNYHVDDEFYSEYISDGLVKVATGYKYNTVTKVANTFRGAVNNKTSATWNEFKDLTRDEYKQNAGVYPGEYIDYIVSRQTINKDDCVALQKQANGNYKFILSLNNYSTVNYTKKMQFVAGTQATQFDKIVLTVEIDANVNFVSINMYEEYYALGMKAVSDLTQTYDFVKQPVRK